MATSLMLILYFAGMLTNLKVVLGLITGIFVFCSFMYAIFGRIIEGDSLEWNMFKIPIIVVSITGTMLILLPEKQTIYMMAGVYTAGQMTDTEEFQLVRKMITNELHEIVDAQTIKKEKK